MTKLHSNILSGIVSVPLIVMITCLMSGLTLIVSYVITQKEAQEPAFPGASIVSTVNHFPQFIVFRIGEQVAALGIFFISAMEYLMSATQAKLYGTTRILNQLSFILGFTASLSLILFTASMDTGNMNLELVHTSMMVCFVSLSLFFLLNLLTSFQFKGQRDQVSNESLLFFKLILIISLIGMTIFKGTDIPNYQNIQEYVIYFIFVVYIGTFAIDWNGYYIQFAMLPTPTFTLARQQLLDHQSTQFCYPQIIQQQQIPHSFNKKNAYIQKYPTFLSHNQQY